MLAAFEADSLADGDSSPRAAVVCERLGVGGTLLKIQRKYMIINVEQYTWPEDCCSCRTWHMRRAILCNMFRMQVHIKVAKLPWWLDVIGHS